jgi:hypothetical protein
LSVLVVSVVDVSRRSRRQSTEESAMLIDCDTCEVRGIACGDCVITVLLGSPPAGVHLDEDDAAALAVLAEGGLVPPLRLQPGDGASFGSPLPEWVQIRRLDSG